MALQNDGKIVVAGRSFNGSNDDFAVVRYNVDGTLDTGFGTGGKVTTNFAGGSSDTGLSVAVQNDGRILVAGYSDARIALARYNADGTLDPNFNGMGKVTTDIGSGPDITFSVVVQNDGKIVAAGFSDNGNWDFAIVRYNANGSLDTSFNGTGKVRTPIGSGTDYGNDVALQDDGKIIVAGWSSNGSNDDFAVVRYNPNGSLDTTFGGTGKVTTNFGNANDTGYSVEVQDDGKILVAGLSETPDNADFALVRYNTNGSVDMGFGTGGKVITNLGSSRDYGSSVALQGDGKIVVAGASGGNFGVVRYEGGPDTMTAPPTLTAPVSGSASTNLVNLAYYLPEPALSRTVKLTATGTVTRVLTLTSVNESVGAHAFTFDVSSPLSSPDIASGSPIPDGVYTVTLSYQDTLGNPAASSAPALNVTLNIDTDKDGIPDKYETGTGIYVSPTDTGTSPTNRDTDGDELTDGQEVNAHGANPNLPDTDADGFDDGFEVATGFSPTNEKSTPDALSSIRTAAEYRFNAALGVSYRIEASTDFANWSTIETNIIGNGGVITRFYSIEGQSQRFFRSRRN
jgi:uncharacterized delta-60 repeat protein